MVKRRIKRNFDEQLANVSSLNIHTPQNLANNETKPNKKRTWHRNRVWRKDDPQTQVGRDPRVNDLPDRPTKVKVDTKSDEKRTWHHNRVWRKDDPQTKLGESSIVKNLPGRPTKVKVDTKPNKKRTWYPNRVWRKNDPQTQVAGDTRIKDLPDRPTKVKGDPGPRRWRYNRIWRRDFVWKKEQSKESPCNSTSSVHATQSAKVVAPKSDVKTATLPRADSARAIASASNTTHTSASTEKPTACQSTAPLSKGTEGSKTETISISVPSETAVSNTLTESTINKTITNVSSDDQITTFDDNLMCRDKMAPTISTPCASSSKKERETISVNTRPSFPSTEEKMDRKSSKRKRPEIRNIPNKRVFLKQSADDTRLSCRWLWSIETLMEQLCLAFEGVFL